MHWLSHLGTLVILLAVGADGAATKNAPPQHPMDPWVFRCTLDKTPRQVVVALSDDYFLAYDLQRCALAKVWKPAPGGGVYLTGPVYDKRHGPQPQSRGTMLLEVGDATWQFETAAGDRTDVETHYLGYHIDEATGEVTFEWQFTVGDDVFEVEETPRITDGGLERTLKVHVSDAAQVPQGKLIAPGEVLPKTFPIVDDVIAGPVLPNQE